MTSQKYFYNKHVHYHRTDNYFRITGQILLILMIVFSLLGAKPLTEVHAADFAWVAYNDCSGTTGGNTTAYTVTAGSTSGVLKNYATGASTGVTVTFTSSGNPYVNTSTGTYPSSGTDAYNTFYSKANMAGVIQYGNSGYYIDMTFTGLNPAKTYTFATTANRNDASYADRISRFTISDIDGATNASTSGVNVIDNYSVYFSTGYNTTNGYVARWTGIQPGTDGDFTVRVQEQTAGNKGYGPSVFMLAEEASSTPTITTTGTLTTFTSPVGVPSAEQSYTVSGNNLTDNIVVTAPADFEISTTSGSGFTSSLTLIPTGGVVSPTTIYVRFNRSTEGTSSGNITHESTGATRKEVAVSGTATQFYTLTVNSSAGGSVTLNPAGGSYASGTVVTLTAVPDSGYAFDSWSGDLTGNTNPATITMDGDKTIIANFVVSPCTNVSLVATADTRMRFSQPTTNYGSETTVTMSPNQSYPQGGLFKWDTSVIPSGAIVNAASLSFYVTDSSTYTFSLYNLRRAWGESTATWNTYDGTNSWGTAGAANTSTDRYNTNLWNVTSSTFSASGNVTIDLNASGVAVIQDWIDGVLPNYGLTVQNYNAGSSSTSDYWIVASKEDTSGYTKPTLNITYCSGPKITTAGTLTTFSTQPGVPSAAQTYTVSGKNLTADINISAPSGFELSTDGSSFNSSLTLPQTGGVVNPTTIYVRLNSATEGTFSGDIVHSSDGASDVYVAVAGTVGYEITVTFQYGASGYTGTDDTFIRGSTEGDTNFGSNTALEWDDNTGTTTDEFALIRFTQLFTSEGGPIPDGATIISAALAYRTVDSTPTGTPEGDPANVYEVLVSWAGSTVTYNNFGGDQGVQSDEYRATPVVQAPASSADTNYSIDVTASLQRWSANPSDNLGWIFYPTGTDGVTIYSSEAATVAYRPYLTVTYAGSVTRYTLSAGNDGHGTVTLNPAGGTYNEGTVVTLTPVPNSGYAFASWSGPNASDLVDNGNGTWSITMNGNKSVTANFSIIPVNAPPNQPVLVQPADAATNVSIPPTLEVTVSDNDPEDTLDVSFYGREKGEAGPITGEDFTLVVIPDTQNMSQSYPAVFTSMTQWIVDNKTSSNIVFVTHVGDIVNTSTSTTQWQNADAAMDLLDAASIPYSVGPGNHDLYGSYSTYFGTSRFSGKSWYGGSYDSSNYNNYSLFSASGMDFILINLQYSASSDILNWADGLLKTYSNRRGIVVQHDILNTDDTWNNQTTYNALKDNPNLFLMLCGHMHSTNDGAAYRQETGDDGHTIHIMMADYQDYPNGGNGYMRILRFSPSNDTIYATTYSPYVNTFITSSPDQMNMAYDMIYQTPVPYSLIGTVENVANGANASVSWTGLSENTEYEWYATVSDDIDTVTGVTWSFTTAAVSPTCYTLTLSHTGNGSDPTASPVKSAACSTNGQYVAGEVITLSAVPDPGWQIASWTGTSAPSSNTLTMPASNHTASVTYSQIPYTLTVNIVGNGTVTKNPNQDSYHYGDVVQLTATPAAGWSFSGWSGDLSGSDNPKSITIQGNASVTATFSAIPCYTLTLSHTGNGSDPTASPVKSAACSTNGQYVAGEVITLSAVPDPGWQIASWTGTSAPSSNTLTMPASNHTASVTYSQIPYTLTVNIVGNGTVTKNPNQDSYHYGDVVQLTATPAAGWSFSGWSGDLSGSDNPKSITIQGNASVTATFSESLMPPTDISLSNSSVAENQPIGTEVGTFTVIDPDSTTHTLTFCGGVDDASFSITGDILKTAAVFNYENKNSYQICVRADDGQGGTFDKEFTISVTDAPGIELITPEDGAVLHYNIPTFDWEDFAGAKQYQIQVSRNANFTSLVLNAIPTASQYTPSVSLPANTTLYWRVRAKLTNTSFSAWSEVWMLKTANPPSTPVLLAPANNALVTNYQPTLDWKQSSVPLGTAFDRYQVQVDDNADFSSPVVDKDVAGLANHLYALETALSPNTRYYWRVRAWNTNGDYSAWSAVRYFRAAMLPPVLVTPADSENVRTRRPVLDWDDVDGASGYTLQISRNATFTRLIGTYIIKTATSTFTPAADLPAATTLYWRVRANGVNGPSLYSNVRSFVTGNPPSIPTLLAPANNALVTNYQPTLDWKQSSVPLGTAFDRYQVQVDDNADFSSPVVDKDVAGLANHLYALETALSPNTRYYWRVRAWNTNGDYSAWSAVRYFRAAMLPPVLSAPVGGVLVDSRRPTFDWEDVVGANGYTIQISTTTTFFSLLVNANIAGGAASTYKPAVNLPANKVLYWRVRANGVNGPSAWSTTETFVTPP
ncbi:MAG: DNRLRE domain-containing protein [Anaerolineales bacterium]